MNGKIIGLVAAFALAGVAFLAGGASVTDAAKIATNVETAKAYCAKILDGEAKAQENPEVISE